MMDVGVIGTGMMGRNHARVYSELRNVGTLYIYDVNQAAAEAVASPLAAEVCGSIAALLDRSEAVSICVPTAYHHAVSSEVLAAEMPALIEKPICATSSEGEALLSLIPEGLTVGVGHIERFNPIVPEISRIIREPHFVELKRHNPSSARNVTGSVVEDLMIHDIDIILQLFPNQSYTLSSAGSPSVCSALFRFDKTPVSLSASRMAAKKVRSIYIEEEDCTIEGNFMTQEVTIYRRPDSYAVENQRYVQESVIESVMVNKVEPLKLELSTFLTCVRDGTPFPVTPGQAVANLRVCEEISRGLSQ